MMINGLERWQSGRSRRTRNAEYGQPYRGFESLPLRHIDVLKMLDLQLSRSTLDGNPQIGLQTHARLLMMMVWAISTN